MVFLKKKINDLFHYFMNSSNYVFLLLAFTTFHTNPQPGCKQYINYFISFNSIPAQMVSSLSNTELILTFFVDAVDISIEIAIILANTKTSAVCWLTWYKCLQLQRNMLQSITSTDQCTSSTGIKIMFWWIIPVNEFHSDQANPTSANLDKDTGFPSLYISVQVFHLISINIHHYTGISFEQLIQFFFLVFETDLLYFCMWVWSWLSW